MATLGEAWQKVNGRMRGVIEAEQAGELAMAAATTAGTDVDGPDLSVRIGFYSDVVVGELLELLARLVPVADVEAGTVTLRDFVYRHNNGTALAWFWAGYELRRLQEGES